MALYPLQCTGCEKETEVFLPMAEAGSWPACDECHAPTRRLYRGVMETGTENVFRSFWSEQLSQNADGSPVYVKSRAEWNQLMKAQGVQPYERGMDFTGDRHRTTERSIAERKSHLQEVVRESQWHERRHHRY